ncbi:hypothetical protein J7F03_34625 [Streptomyces sp. ISL-43]|uniref:hypothetical protein n=1 Tax=Streptomyces sp. ISL-43 TaxID=2819183 RepID=UPI001BECCD58|nr:hypothetical protein [Streptomyces sp. ISL-43]MBT2452105.1 hypothetical protein [Streptomyces sp. ISL-43]
MKLPLTIHQARLGPAEFKVIRPARPPARAALSDGRWYLHAQVDQAAAQLIAGLWTLAATSPRSLVHVPLRRARPDAQEPGLDLVLLHHSLQFAPSRWKELRARLGPGRPQTADLPGPASADPAVDPWPERHHKENRDRFHQRVHAGTLFMTGSAKLFADTAWLFADIAHRGPGYVLAHPDHQHYCTRLRPGNGVLAAGSGLHVVYRDQWPD